jgi:FtsP/CotA-like multicopper oxidase with cupredoxin domain
MTRWLSYAAVAVLAVAPAAPAALLPVADNVTPNDNRQSAGTLDKGVLTIALEARTGSWRPEGDNGRTVDVAAFAEEGKPLSTPGPLIRVPLGTQVRVTVRNRLD